jgi:hypothetical protein
MRNKRPIVLAFLSCCCLYLTQSCNPDLKTVLQEDGKETQNAREIAISSNSAESLGAVAAMSNNSTAALVGELPTTGRAPLGADGSLGGQDRSRGGHDNEAENDHGGCSGPVDCANPSCRGRSCNDHDGCTEHSQCIDFECKPKNYRNPCIAEVHNECAQTQCTSTGDNSHYCSFELDHQKTEIGSCTPEDNCKKRNTDGTCAERNIIDQCTLGHCVLDELCPIDNQPPVTCKSQNRNTIPVGICVGGSNAGNTCADIEDSSDCAQGTCQPQGGCLDTNQCTADSCFNTPKNNLDINDDMEEAQQTYQCHYEALHRVACNTDNPCEISECQIVDGDPSCVPINIAFICPPINQCHGEATAGGMRVGFCDNQANCMSDPIGRCLDDSTCPSGSCVGVLQGICSNDETTACYVDEQCESGTCVGGSLGTCTCETDSPCMVGTCDDAGACIQEPSPVGTECNDGISCHQATCDGLGHCNVVVFNDAVCVAESCDNPCVEPVCTATGCYNIYTNGQISCEVFVENQGLCQGTATCVNGLGECIPNNPLNCVAMSNAGGHEY